MTAEPTLVFSTAPQQCRAAFKDAPAKSSINKFSVTSGDLAAIFSSNPAPNTFSISAAPPPRTTTPATVHPYPASTLSYHGAHTDHNHRHQHRFHHDFKALSKEERHRVVQQEAAQTDLLSRTVHLRFLPTMMKQGELAALCRECGEYQRVRICGNSTNNQNWIYGFVEFSTKEGADNMMRLSGMELHNGPNRPSLRLKCNNAKSPIVDRIFHDANPEDGRSKCIFGHDNYAHRTLKDALDSYFHLKEKEAQQQRDEHVTNKIAANGSGSENGEGGQSAGLSSAERSPHTKPFTLSPSAVAYNPLQSSPALHGMPGLPPAMAHPLPFTVTEEAHVPPPPSYEVASATTSLHATPALHVQPINLGILPPPFPEMNGSGCLLPASASSMMDGAMDGHREGLTSMGTADAAASQLSHALEQLMRNTTGTDGEEILARGRALAVLSMKQSLEAMRANRNFHHALGTLRSLLALLDEHVNLTGGEKNTGAGDLSSELPQRVTQLRLLAHVLITLFCMYRRQPNEALPHIQCIVAIVTGVPSTPITVPAAVLLRRFLRTTPESQLCRSRSAPVEPGMFAWLAGEPEELQQAMMNCLPDEDDDVARDASRHQEEDAAAEALYDRDVAFQAFILNVLVTVGLAMEGIQPGVARSTYTCAATRAEEVLGISSPALASRLAEKGPITEQLCRSLLGRDDGRAGAMAAQRDITTFPREFFASMELMDVDAYAGMTEEEDVFWSTLPPLHHVHLFSPSSIA